MPEIVNVVASGSLGRELDVASVAEDIDAGDVDTQAYEYRTPTLYVKEHNGSPLATVYESGSYHISGAKSVDEAEATRDWLISALEDLGIEIGDVSFSVANVVVVGDLEEEIDMNKLVVDLGLEATEYEPEQFPGLVYRPEDSEYVFLIFSSGRVVIPGAPDAETAFNGFDELKKKLTALAK